MNYKKNKVIIIVAYFGNLPNYFQLWLDSCFYNKKIDFLLFTDDKKKFIYPSNVFVNYCSFYDIKKLVQEKYNFRIALNYPYKLCDFRPAYGEIFNEYLNGYDYWGHCDLDMIFGDIYSFLHEAIFKSYDKIMVLGHLALYKNTYENNNVYKEKIFQYIDYKNIFSSSNGFGFDEIGKYAINTILKQKGKKIYYKDIYADIDEMSSGMDIVHYNIEKNNFLKEKKEQIFSFENGKVYSNFYENNKYVKKEYLYVHFQKRRMFVEIDRGMKPYIISNKGFFSYDRLCVKNMKKYMKKISIQDIYKIKRKSFFNYLKRKIDILLFRITYVLKSIKY